MGKKNTFQFFNVLLAMKRITNVFLFIKNRLYDDCTYSNGIKSTRKQSLQLVYGGLNDYPCGGDLVMADYLNLSVVHEALHVRKTDFFSVDNAEGDFDYIPSERDLTNFYKEVNGKLRVLVYNGGTVAPVIFLISYSMSYRFFY